VKQEDEDFERKYEPEIEIDLNDPAFVAYRSVMEKFKVAGVSTGFLSLFVLLALR
jgi:hypothetical protein